MNETANHPTFSQRILTWFDTHGRHDLPWQQHQKPDSDIYAVWLSEIMLQQTQVATVIDYFGRFMAKFDDVQKLAQADWEDVAALWAGLGYYARARNLHAGAKQVQAFIDLYGHFPQTTDEWQTIKGVGRSTAGAIVAMGVRKFGVICDGNVKRVLTRHQGIKGDITKSATDKELWALATRLTPKDDSGRYAQAMMDMGATLCTRTRPKCHICPIATDCVAYQTNSQTAYPVKPKKSAKPTRHSLVLCLTYGDELLWLKRQNTQKDSIWHGLWCLPLLTQPTQNDTAINSSDLDCDQLRSLLIQDSPTAQALEQALYPILATFDGLTVNVLPNFRHTLTHFHWQLTPLCISLNDQQFCQINQALSACSQDHLWQPKQTTLALPKAMHKVLALL